MGLWRTKDIVAESPRRIAVIAAQLGEPPTWVADVVCDLRFVIDRFVADDVTVLAPPFLVRRRGDPVWVALRDQSDEDWDKVKSFDDEHLATVLGLELSLVRRHPVVGDADLVCDLWDVRGHDLDAIDAGETNAAAAASRDAAVVTAWLDLWDPEREEYDVSRVGLERSFQAWLLEDLGRLAAFGLPVELVKEEHRFVDGRKADLLCRATSDSELVRRGDLVVIENKAHMVDVPACEQLHGYVELTAREVASAGQRVHGVLIADGRTLQLQQELLDRAYHYISLSALGYRDWLRASSPAPAGLQEADVVRRGAVTTQVPEGLSVEVTGTRSAAGRSVPRGPWVIDGVEYGQRSAANRALAAVLGQYTTAEWEAAQRLHGLR